MPLDGGQCTCELCTGTVPDWADDDYNEPEPWDDDDLDDGDGTIRSYSYKPVPAFHGEGPLYLGAEIEVQTGWSTSRPAATANSFLGSLGYLKDDSSIGGGFEIVTHPMSYQYAMQQFPWQMLLKLHEEGARAAESCGLHVHVSKAGFASKAHQYRWLKFIYRNSADVVKIARRESSDWAPFRRRDRRNIKEYVAPTPPPRDGSQAYWDWYYSDGRIPNRYSAVNVTNEDTFELRVFASSLQPEEVQSALAFAAASVEYTRSLSAYSIAHEGGWTWEAFRAWVDERPEYAPLSAQMSALI